MDERFEEDICLYILKLWGTGFKEVSGGNLPLEPF